MNREELNWLLQTIQDAKDAERLVLAQYARGRISFQLMADIAEERGWSNRPANQFAIATAGCFTGFATTQFPIVMAR
ncbi:MAG TPA: hypothetical protein VM781_00140 [Candidatus Bathyarchaeia archaeon]|nr:hypothetical protein [Candidatus Bathyarchaeia archaeon]